MNLPPVKVLVEPKKKSKPKIPDFEKALTNWVWNRHQGGLSVSDKDLQEQARVFLFNRSDQAIILSPSWFEKFKQKNRLGKYAESTDQSTTASNTNKSPFGFPDLSTDVKTPGLDKGDSQAIISPLSPSYSQDDDEMTNISTGDTFRGPATNSLHLHSQGRPHLGDYPSGTSRPPTATTDSKPQFTQTLTTSLVTETSVNPLVAMKRHKSVPDIHQGLSKANFSQIPPQVPAYSRTSSPMSNLTSPGDDENIKALHVMKRLLQQNPGVADAEDYLAISKLIEKMKLLRNPTPSTARLDMGKEERKRHFVGIS